MSSYLFTSESVSEGHPDKVADQISDAVLDAIIKKDPAARVACETFIKTGVAIIGGEITTSAWVDLEELIRKVIVDIGYDSSEVGFDGNTCAIVNIIGKQSRDIDLGVSSERPEEQGAGDQGMMFGYATNETEVLMPAPIFYAHELVKRQSLVRRTTDDGRQHLRPDAKSQVTFRYENGIAAGIDAVVLSTQHCADSSQEDLRELVMEEIIKPVLPGEWLNGNTKYLINPTGRFEIGGPVGDAGLTGVPQRTPAAMWQRISSQPDSPTGWKSRCPMPSGWPSPLPSVWRLLVPNIFRLNGSNRWSGRNSTCGPTASSGCWT